MGGGMSPTERTLAHMRKAGCRAQVVEHWNAFAKRRIDLFGIVDVLALSPEGETIGVQATSLTNVSSRVNKIAESDALSALRRCGWKLLVHGWGKGADGKIRMREVDVS